MTDTIVGRSRGVNIAVRTALLLGRIQSVGADNVVQPLFLCLIGGLGSGRIWHRGRRTATRSSLSCCTAVATARTLLVLLVVTASGL